MLNYWDFLYFSGITQTTVGYGDMLPNSTAIRMIVLAQILIGYFIIAVILNISLTTS
jgi:voltage-gated potassium channel